MKGESFTTHDLVKEAGVALQTFYRYFAGKDELLLAVIEDMVVEACAAYETRAEGIADPIERLHSHITSVVDLLAAAPDGARTPGSSPLSTGDCHGSFPTRSPWPTSRMRTSCAGR